MKPPNYQKYARKVIGVVNYYRNMWARCPHTLAPLTKITSNKVKFTLTKIKQDAFDEIMRVVARDTLIIYPDYNENFNIHTNAINFQLGEVIRKKVKSIAFYSRQMFDSQKRYVLTEK